MSDTEFLLNGAVLTARPSGVLWWEAARILCVSDLHLGKAERLARRGGALLPPYDTRETLAHLAAEIAVLDPRTVICLGDSFDDAEAARRLDDSDRYEVNRLMAGRRWIWIAGNHDPDLPEIGGSHMAEAARGPLTFRHIALPRAEPGEVSGHYHPKAQVPTRAGMVSRPCFIHDGTRLILPAFGAYTGGLPSESPSLQGLFGDAAVCILIGDKTTTLPMRPRQTA